MTRTVLVTGGCGFIGANFVRLLLESEPEWRVVNLDKLTYAGNLQNLSDVQDHFAFGLQLFCCVGIALSFSGFDPQSQQLEELIVDERTCHGNQHAQYLLCVFWGDRDDAFQELFSSRILVNALQGSCQRLFSFAN